MRAKTFASQAALTAALLCACGSADPEHRDPNTAPTTAPKSASVDSGSEVNATTTSAPGNGQHEDWRGQPLGETVDKGLAFLAAAQGDNGGFGQDGREPRTGQSLESEGYDVANTAMVALAMLRAGTTPKDGQYTDQLLAAVDYVLGHVEKAADGGLAITNRSNTQIQRKLGRYVDTFLAAMLLAELKGQMPDPVTEKRVCAALDKCVDKIEKNQSGDGSWNGKGAWAPVISTSLASRGLDAAKAKGVKVNEEILARVEAYTSSQFDDRSGKFAVGGDAAGIELYKFAQAYEQASRKPASAGNTVMLDAADRLLSSEQFQAGFGSMGGEEFISYMNISDSLLRKGGEKWQKWNGDIKTRLIGLQNKDGSWAGHHCITGRVACTSAALMTLLAERTAAAPSK